MNDRDLKQLIGKLTGIRLVQAEKTVSAMANQAGAGVMFKNRRVQWSRCYPNQAMQNVPPNVLADIQKCQQSFISKFAVSGGEPAQMTELIFSWLGKDVAIDDNRMAALMRYPDENRKAAWKEAIDFMNSHGIPLSKSQQGMHRWAQMPENKNVDQTRYMGSDWYFGEYGYAWGARKTLTNKTIRNTDHVTPDEADKMLKSGNLDNLSVNRGGNSYPASLTQVVVSKKNNGWGLFLQDMGSGKMEPAINDAYYIATNKTSDDKNFADKAQMVKNRGGHTKFYGYLDDRNNFIPVRLSQTQFRLPRGPQDPKPIAVPTARNQAAGYSMGGRDDRYYIWPKNDGTLWWIPATQHRGVGHGSADAYPLTEEQVKMVCGAKLGSFWMKAKINREAYDPKTIGPEQRENYLKITHALSDVYDTLTGMGMEPQHVGLNAYKFVIIGPAFKNPESYGIGLTTGRMTGPSTIAPEDQIPEAKEGLRSDEKIVKRTKWVVMSNEYNSGKAETKGTGGFDVAQSVDGMSADAYRDSLMGAIQYISGTWGVNTEMPNAQEMQAAEELFNRVNRPERINPPGEVPPGTADQAAQPETPPTGGPANPTGAPQGSPVEPGLAVKQQPVGAPTSGDLMTAPAGVPGEIFHQPKDPFWWKRKAESNNITKTADIPHEEPVPPKKVKRPPSVGTLRPTEPTNNVTQTATPAPTTTAMPTTASSKPTLVKSSGQIINKLKKLG